MTMVLQCLLISWLNGLASRDQHRLMGSGSALEVCSRRWAIQMAVFTLRFTLLLLGMQFRPSWHWH